MVQLEVKLRIKHERGNRRRRRRRWRKRDGVVRAARGERDRKERESGVERRGESHLVLRSEDRI